MKFEMDPFRKFFHMLQFVLQHSTINQIVLNKLIFLLWSNLAVWVLSDKIILMKEQF